MDEEDQPHVPQAEPSLPSPFSNNDNADHDASSTESPSQPTKLKSRKKDIDSAAASKRRCVSTACIACRRRKSKCDGNTPSCAACASVYGTDCVYDPNSDHRRKGVYKKDIDNLKTRNSTLQTLIQAILNYPEHEVPDLVKQIRTCESLDDVAESILARDVVIGDDDQMEENALSDPALSMVPKFERELSGKLGELRLENGSVSVVGGTSNLLYMNSEATEELETASTDSVNPYQQQEDPLTSWTEVTSDPELVVHLLSMYFTWHYAYFTTLSKALFYRDFLLGKPPPQTKRKTEYCTGLLVNAMLALGCHFTSWPAARQDPSDSATAGDHFFKEAKRLILQNDEHEKPKLATVQALALMSVREAGCGREARGWVYSGMSFRMAFDLGLNIDSMLINHDEAEIDARRITIWGSFLFDKCWSNYLGRQPQLPLSSIAAPKFDVFPMEDAELWTPYLDSGKGQANSQPSRTRTVALQISALCEISGDLLLYFYHPTHLEKPLGKQAELKKLSELHTRLEAWKKTLPKELEAREGQLPAVLVMHMFFQLLFIHLFRPFLRYKGPTSPLPVHVSPRKLCTQAANMISKIVRIYKRTHGLRQIVNIAVYILHSACTIHILNLPDKNAERDIIHGVKHLEEIAESWICARKTLDILHVVSKRWNIELPKEAEKVFARTEAKFGPLQSPKSDTSPPMSAYASMANSKSLALQHQQPQDQPQQQQQQYQNKKSTTFPLSMDGFTAPQSQMRPVSSSAMPNMTRPSPSNSINPQQMPQPASTNLSTKHRRQSYALPPSQQDLWNQDRVQRGPTASQTSPTVLFGGVDSLVQDSQDWWYKGQGQLFANWNDVGTAEAMMATSANGGLQHGGGQVGYGAEGFGINGGAYGA